MQPHLHRPSRFLNPGFVNPTPIISTTKSSTISQTMQKTITAFSIKTKLLKIFKTMEFEKSKEQSNTMNSDLESLETFDIFSTGLINTKSLENLNLASTNLPDINMIKLAQSLAKNKSIKSLDLSNNIITSLGFKYLFRMLKENHTLESLNLFNNEIQKESIEDFNGLIMRNKNLIDLNLNFCGLDTLSVRALLEALTTSTHFKKIHLSKNFFDKKSFHGFGIFLSNFFMNMESLEFAYNGVDAESLKIIKQKLRKMPLENMMPTIQEINLMGNKLNTPDAIKYMKYILERISGIQTLNLSRTFLNYLNFRELSPSFKRIHHTLILANNIFKDQLPEFTNLIHLKVLNLSKTGLCGGSVRNIAKVLSFEPQIQWISLDLSRNRLDTEDVKCLFEALRYNKTLQTLNLAENEFDEHSFDGFDTYCEELNIKELNISHNPFKTSDFIEKLLNNKAKNPLRTLILDSINFDNANLMTSKKLNFGSQKLEKLSFQNSLSLGPILYKNCLIFLELVELNLENSCILNKERITDLANFLILTTKLTTLSLSNLYLGRMSIKEIEIICEAFPLNKSLVNLDLSYNKLNKTLDLFLKGICQIKTLRCLDLSWNNLSNKNSQILSDFLINAPFLESYNLSNNLISFVTVDKICNAVIYNNDKLALNYLNLSNISFSLDCLISIGYLLNNSTKLKTLDLSNNEIVKINTATLYKSSKVLLDLTLRNCVYDEYQYRLLIKLLMKHPLESVDLSGARFLEADLTQFIKKTSHLQSLTNLDISYIALKDIEIGELLHRLKRHPNLKRLKLNFLDLKQNSSESLQKLLKFNKSIEELDLSENKLSAFLVNSLKLGLITNNSLKILLLKKTRFTDNLLNILSEAFQTNVTLKHLDLRWNNFSVKSLETLIMNLNVNTYSKKGLEVLLLSNNHLECKDINEEFTLLEFSQLLKLNQTLSDIDLANTFPMKPSEVNALTESLKITTNLRRLNLNNNNLGKDQATFLGKLILSCHSLQYLSISKNKLGISGIKSCLEHMDKNLTLKEIDISNTLLSEDESVELCNFIQSILTNNYNCLEIINISGNFIAEKGNKILYNILRTKKNIYFLNTQWEKIRNDLAIQVLESLKRLYEKNDENCDFQLRHLNFSTGKLDDDFCIYFSHHIHEYDYLESLNISENKKITLIGLKFIYVYLKFNVRLKRIYFKEYSHESALNNGIATSLVHWSKYTPTHMRIIKFFQKIANTIFSKMQMNPNRFQYNESFDKFFAPINDYLCFCFFLLNFFAQMFLAIFLPPYFIMDHCGEGQRWTSHIVYGCYLGITLLLEICFWIASRKHILSNVLEKDLQREVFINDLINLLGGVLLRFDTYTDVCFLTIAHQCHTGKILLASLIVILIKLGVKSIQNLRTLYKLLMRIQKKQKMDCLNLYAKLCCFQSWVLTNDILDRYCPGNAKKIHHILCKKLHHSIYLNIFILDSLLKFLLEDIPQTILQSLFLFYKQSDQDRVDYTNSSNWIIWFSVIKNCISLIGSFYSMVVLRPSYIEQSDFDECLTVQKIFKGEKNDHGYGLTFLKRMNVDRKTKIGSKSTFLRSMIEKESKIMISGLKKTLTDGQKIEYEGESDVMVDLSEDVSFEKVEKMQYFTGKTETLENGQEDEKVLMSK